MAWNTEWLNENAGRAYPFKEDSLLTDTTGAVRIPNNLIVDLCLVAPADFNSLFYLRQLSYVGTTVTLTLSVTGGDDLASVSVNASTHIADTSYPVIGVDGMDDVRGMIALGDLSGLASQLAQGIYVFTAGNTQFETRAVRPDLRGVRSLAVVKADGTLQDPLYGAVQLAEGANIVLTYVPATDTLPQGIRIDSRATNLEDDCECSSAQAAPSPILTINGIPADNTGNFTLEPLDECLAIDGTANGLTFNDTCSQPCCGCAEQAYVTQQMQVLQTSITALTSRASQLQAAETAFYTTVLATLTSGV